MTKQSVVALFALCAAGMVFGCAAQPADDQGGPAETQDPLKTKDHSAISGAACRAHGLPEAFCVRVEGETFDVDLNEWTTLAAHAQPEAGQTSCEAAAAVQSRLRSLGGEIRDVLSQGSPSQAEVNTVAKALGRSLHTVQDNCAHNGMTNPQHAWYSVRDWCISSGESPDTQPEALQCAREETDSVMRGFRDALRAAGIEPSALGTATRVSSSNPGRSAACGFLREWKNFSGRDTRWDNEITRGEFRGTLVDSFRADKEAKDICAGGRSIATPARRADVSVSDPFCPTLRIFCVGT